MGAGHATYLAVKRAAHTFHRPRNSRNIHRFLDLFINIASVATDNPILASIRGFNKLTGILNNMCSSYQCAFSSPAPIPFV